MKKAMRKTKGKSTDKTSIDKARKFLLDCLNGDVNLLKSVISKIVDEKDSEKNKGKKHKQNSD